MEGWKLEQILPPSTRSDWGLSFLKTQRKWSHKVYNCASVLFLVILGFGCCLLSSLAIPRKKGIRREKKEWIFNGRVLTGEETCIHGSRDDLLRCDAQPGQPQTSGDCPLPLEPDAILLISICTSQAPLKFTTLGQVLWRRRDVVEKIKRGLNKSRWEKVVFCKGKVMREWVE